MGSRDVAKFYDARKIIHLDAYELRVNLYSMVITNLKGEVKILEKAK